MRQSRNPWYLRDGGDRFARDQKSLAEAFPDLAFRTDEEAGRVSLEGTLTLVAECGVPTRIAIRIDFPVDYPYEEPRAYEIGGRFAHVVDRHFFEDGQCCLWLPPESRWNSEDSLGLFHFLEEVAVFLDQQLVYEAEGLGTWPGAQRSHGDRGYLEFMQEELGGDWQLLAVFAPVLLGLKTERVQSNDRCPCGSRRKYKRCHKRRVEDIRRRLGNGNLQAILGQWYERASGNSHNTSDLPTAQFNG